MYRTELGAAESSQSSVEEEAALEHQSVEVAPEENGLLEVKRAGVLDSLDVADSIKDKKIQNILIRERITDFLKSMDEQIADDI